MKNKIAFLTAALAVLVSVSVNAQKFSGLDKSPMDMASFPTSYKVSEKFVRILYSRPQLKGRSINELAPNGKVWRTGANEAPEITFYEDVIFGDQEVSAGTYQLFTMPNTNEWTIILNEKQNQWGSYFYDESADVAKTMVKSSFGKENIEAFSIVFEETTNGATMIMGWGTLRVSVPIKAMEE